jgi:hypothetical protein
MSIEDNIERIADSLALIERHMSVAFGNQTAAPNTTAPTMTASAAGALVRSRQEIKDELDRLGVPYNERLRTEGLEKLLKEVKAAKGPAEAAAAVDKAEAVAEAETETKAPAEPTPVNDGFFAGPEEVAAPAAPVAAKLSGKVPAAAVAAAPAKVKYTVEQAIEFAKRLAAKFGPDKSVAIINSYGCKNVTEINAAGKLQDFVAKILAKEREHEGK